MTVVHRLTTYLPRYLPYLLPFSLKLLTLYTCMYLFDRESLGMMNATSTYLPYLPCLKIVFNAIIRKHYKCNRTLLILLLLTRSLVE